MQKSTAVRTAAALWKQRKELRRRIRLMYKRNCFPLSYVYIILHMQQHCKFLPNKKAASHLAAFCILQIEIISCVSGVCIQFSSFRHSQCCGNHVSKAHISIWIYRLFCFFFYIVLYARRFREKIS